MAEAKPVMSTAEVLGTFVGIPLAICGLITAAVCLSERVLARRRKPDTTSTPPSEPVDEEAAETATSEEAATTPDEKEQTE